MKTYALIGSGLLVLVAAFVLLPKLALRVSGGNDVKNADQPLTKAASASATAASTPSGADPIESFADLASKAGFTPLDPGVVPSGFVPEGSYVLANGAPTVVFAFRNGEGRYLLITERRAPQGQSGVGSPRNRSRGYIPPDATPRPDAPQIVQLTNGATGIFQPDDRRLTFCGQDDPTAKYTCGDQPAQDVRFTSRGLDLLVASDGRDLSRDDLLKTAAGLR